MKARQEKIVVVGYGWVGQANALALITMGYEVAYYDPNQPPQHYLNEYSSLYSKITRLETVTAIDDLHTVYVVCVGDKVSEEGVQDISLIESVLETLKGVKGIVVLRATIIPDTLERLDFDYYVPEFLHEKTAVAECIKPYFVVVGKNAQTKKTEPTFLAEWRLRTPRHFDGTPREASFIKYLSNLWNATRIGFVNEFGDTVMSPDTPEAVTSINRIINFVLGGESYVRYGRAFDGHCLPKDSRAFAFSYKEKGSGTALLQGLITANNQHARLEERYKHLPKWFSAWENPHMSGFVAMREFLYSIKKNFLDPREFIGRYYSPKRGLIVIILLVALFLIF